MERLRSSRLDAQNVENHVAVVGLSYKVHPCNVGGSGGMLGPLSSYLLAFSAAIQQSLVRQLLDLFCRLCNPCSALNSDALSSRKYAAAIMEVWAQLCKLLQPADCAETCIAPSGCML